MGSTSILYHLLIVAPTTIIISRDLALSSWHLLTQIINSYLWILDVMPCCVSDGGIFHESTLSAALESNALDFPPPEPLPGCTLPIPYMVVADAAFPLKDYIQKPYSQMD